MTKQGGASFTEAVGSPELIGILCLTSGERVRIQGTDAPTVRRLIQAFAASTIVWSRLGALETIDRELTNEARNEPPSVLVLARGCDWVPSVSAARMRYGATPILAVSARSGAELEALAAGANAFCAFPADRALFEARLRALLRLRESGTFPAQGGAQAIALSASSRTLRVGSTAVQLSPSEYALVEALLERKDQWVPREALWKALARESSGHDSSLLRMHAMQVRRKLGDERWVLQSQRGKGMMLTTMTVYKPLSRRPP
ncbi:MAG TPA: winged helix-turn-helix domain-containing protein [Polyangiaceae bacterium]|nr:winged helix-turn-helix domain-containing protein [Polyangiaceae bacterium]